MLTSKQHQLLVFIEKRLDDTGISPSFDEMKDALGLKSKSGIHRLVTALEERGFILRLPNKARALDIVRRSNGTLVYGDKTQSAPEPVEPKEAAGRIVPFTRTRKNEQDDQITIPLHGRIAAGTPIEALESVSTHIPVPSHMLGSGTHYALTIDGDSMVEAGILDGDTVVIQSCDTARDGEIVVALVDNQEATLKTLRRMGHEVALVPANRHFQTQLLDARRVRIQGRLVGLLRRY